jgi:predicted dehydrogenase
VKADCRFEIAGICEEDEAAAANAFSAWGIERNCRSFDELLNNVEFDVLAIGDYYGIRGQRAVAALRCGKHILSDKPLCTSQKELSEISQLVKQSGKKIGIMLDFRDYPCMKAAKSLLDSGKMGKIHAISFGGQHPLNYGVRPGWYFEKGKHGGTINDIAIHGLDAVEYLTGAKVARLNCARCWNAFAKNEPDFKDSAQMTFTLYDNCGCIADVSYAAPDSFGFTTPFYWRFTMWGDGGVMEFSAAEKSVRFYRRDTGTVENIPAPEASLSDYLEIFLNEINGGSELFGTDHLLDITETALKLQAQAES